MPRSLRVSAAILLLLACAAFAKSKTPVPAVIAKAKYVAVVSFSANSNSDWFNDPAVTREDREAASAVQEQLQKWDHYRYTIDPTHADIIIAVRSGRRVNVAVGPKIETGNIHIGKKEPRAPEDRDPSSVPGTGPAVGIGAAGDTGPKDDVFAVFVGTNTASAPLWMNHQRNGLEDDLPLFQKFRKDVEQTEKILATAKKP